MFLIRLIVLLLLALYALGMGMTPPSQLNSFGTGVALSAFVLLPALYFLPTYEAWRAGHESWLAIFILNLALGWTFLGWVIAYVWAFKRPSRVVPTRQEPEETRLTKTCPQCAETVLAAAVKCKHCGSALA